MSTKKEENKTKFHNALAIIISVAAIIFSIFNYVGLQDDIEDIEGRISTYEALHGDSTDINQFTQSYNENKRELIDLERSEMFYTGVGIFFLGAGSYYIMTDITQRKKYKTAE